MSTESLALVVPIYGGSINKDFGVKKCTPLPPMHFLPLIHKNNHRNIKLQKHEFGKAWQRDFVVDRLDGEA